MTLDPSGRVLLCVRGEAAEIPLVAGALRSRWGVEPLLLDPARFPNGFPLTLAYDRCGAFRCRWAPEAEEAASVGAVWLGLVVGSDLPEMDADTRQTCVSAAEAALVGLLDSSGVFQLDPYWTKARAENKPLQLRVAQEVGLDLPETIITNDPQAVRAFAERCESMVTKMLVQPVTAGLADDGEVPVVFTTAVSSADLAHLDGLELCPMIFQERVENQLDVRVTIVGKRVFCASLDAAARGGRDLDWRRQSYELDRVPSWAPYDLPAEVGARLLEMLGRFGLNYAACDLVVRPDGRHVFLELNASGSFSFLGSSHAEAIAGAVADVLVDPTARRIQQHA